MKKDDTEFMERISLDLETRCMACKVLDVNEMADRKQLKKAYRRVAMKFHPDKNLQDPEANKKFTLVKCAYELLAEDKPCPACWRRLTPGRAFLRTINTDLIIYGDTFCGGVKNFSI